MKKFTLIAAMLLCCGLSVFADDGDQHGGGKNCQTACTSSIQTQTSEPTIFVKVFELFKFLRF